MNAPDTADRTGLAIGLILVSVLAMTFADAMVKWASADLSLWQIFIARSVVAALVLIAAMRWRGIPVHLKAPLWSLLRSALLVLCWLAFYASLPSLPLSLAAVAVYTNPIMIVLLAALLMREPVSGRQWLGVFTGFAGVLVILQPGSDSFSWVMLLPLLAAAFYAVAMVLTRTRCQDEAPLMLGFSLHLGFLLTGVAGAAVLSLLTLDSTMRDAYPFLLGASVLMDLDAMALMTLLGVLSAAYFVGVARAYQIARPSVIATFDYAYLVWAALWGFVLFAETPSLATVCGMVLITAAGMLVASSTRADNSRGDNSRGDNPGASKQDDHS